MAQQIAKKVNKRKLRREKDPIKTKGLQSFHHFNQFTKACQYQIIHMNRI